MAAHRHWRVYVRVNAGDTSWTNFTEVEMRIAVGGADQCNGGTPSCAGSLQSGAAANIFANDGSASWAQWSGIGYDKWAAYDFGAGNEKDIVEVAIMGGVGAANRAPGDFDIQSSDDGVTWTTEWSGSYVAYVADTFVAFTKPAAAASRHWRVRMLKNMFRELTGNKGFSCGEMEMREAVGGADQCAGGTASARKNAGGSWVPANAFANDGAATSYGSPDPGGVFYSEWLAYDFGSGITKEIIEITTLPRSDWPWWKLTPTTGIVECSSDGRSWIERWRYTDAVGARTYSARHIRPSDIPAIPTGLRRMWGIRVNAINGGTTFAIQDLQLRASSGGATIATGGSAVSLIPNDSSSFPIENAFDATTSIYASQGATGDIVAYDFGFGNEKAAPVELLIAPRGGFVTQAPTDFDLVYSTDGQNWTVLQNFLSAAWVDGVSQTFTVTEALPDGTASGRQRQVMIG